MNPLQAIQHKILDADALQKTIALWRNMQYKIVFTNGCFDILHLGHIHTLAQAAHLGDKLIVGLNSDASVSQLKGDARPIQCVSDRALLLAALQMVDAVVVFNELTPLALIQNVQPDVLVKGGDYDIKNIVGADIVLQKGGLVSTIPFVEGQSTSLLIKKIGKL